ncbi:congested-like trachea protein [Artemia franciscana]|uniref:Mitochondrial carnitine/acylcarnitine carrier protein n=1 Tax=Artemia franciscana TaxID=6661 RepID=A0AA88HWU0_ARTSF|nr:hypothetical protein QYM36_007419 [Artemia franciscana]KAK2717289.1 hypothetical protein QYM36_007419 [Artemia franciscana]KAK2717290.1 hypothetical protein QYM36_007419 [Artemia franciscana]
MSEKKGAQATSPLKDFMAGGFGGVCLVLSGHPFDTIKVRLQTMPAVPPGQKPMYTSALDCCKKTIAREGPRGLYKGMSAPMAGIVPIFALCFAANDVGKKLQMKHKDDKLSLLQLFNAGAFSGVCTTVVMAPGERIKCLLQVQQGGTEPAKYKGSIDCAKQLFKEGGIRSIYKGSLATLIRDVPASGLYFASYEVLMRLLTPANGDRSQLSPIRTLFAGGMAGVANWAWALPPDTIKSRLQTAPEGTYKGWMDAYRALIKEEGHSALFRGIKPVMLRAFVANAACFFGVECARSAFNYCGL